MAQKNYVSLNKLATFLSEAKKIFANTTHEHSISDITDYTVDSILSSTSSNPIENKTIKAEIDTINENIDKRCQVQIITWEDED